MTTITFISIACMGVSVFLSFVLFRDLADISQWFISTDRKKTMRTFYHRRRLVGILLTVWSAGLITGFLADPNNVGIALLVIISGFIGVFLFVGYINPTLMMRPQQRTARYYDLDEAATHLSNDTSLIVVQTSAGVFGYPDRHVLRPHVAGLPHDPDGTVLTYCGLTNMGIAYVPKINGQPIELGVMTQLENNLVMWDKVTGEPIQQFWGTKECDGKGGPKMDEVPSFRMPFARFQTHFPEGKIFLNLYPSLLKNPFFALFDRIVHKIFTHAVDDQARKEAPTFPSIKSFDTRLPNKQKIYGANVGDVYFAVTLEHVQQHNNQLDLRVNGQVVHVVYHPDAQSLGMYLGSLETEGETIGFGGLVREQHLPRLSTLKSEAFWVVWQNFYPQTIVNPMPGEVHYVHKIE